MFQFIDASKLPKLADEMSTEWSLNELRGYAKSPWYASLFPAFWFSQMSGRVATAEMNTVTLKFIDNKKIIDWDNHDLWIFSDWMPNDEKIRSDIIKSITKVNDLNQDYMKELVVRLSENAVIRKHLADNKVISTQALFKLKRDFYFKLLSQGKHIDYSLYNLLLLGDEQKEYLWWYALDPFKNSI